MVSDGVTILAAGGGTARLLTEQECKELTRMINFVLRRIEEIRRGIAAVLTFDITLQKIHIIHKKQAPLHLHTSVDRIAKPSLDHI